MTNNKVIGIKISRSELISTFFDMDIKINSLHQRSSSDFMQLNEFLKDYHKKTRIISENAFRIFETISGEKEMDLINELGKIHKTLEECREKLSVADSRKLQILKNIVSKSNQLNITLRNLRQDFTTLKFLSTNYCLISNYDESEVEWNKNIETWNSGIHSINQLLVSVGLQVEKFKDKVNSCIRNLESRIDKSTDVFHNLSRETKMNIDSVAQKNQESNQHFPILKAKTEDSSKSINNIITYLQYHDIIRQKIEHIQKSHNKIIDDLNNSGTDNTREEDCLPEDYSKIVDIIDLQAAQLLLVNKEYQNALSVITRNFQDIAKDLTIISRISDKFSFNDNNSQNTILRQIKDQLDKGIILLDLSNFNDLNTEYDEAVKKLDLISDQINLVFKQSIKEFAGLRIDTNRKQDIVNSKTGVIAQITSLACDVEIKNHEINERISDIQSISRNVFVSNEMEVWGTQLEMDRLLLMVSISKILDKLDKDNMELDSVLMQNRDLNNDMLEKIESTVNRDDYYIYFEDMVEQIIRQLSGITDSIKPDNSDNNKENKAANLKDFKSTYTMESERIIHDNVVMGFGVENTKPDKDSENEIEFF